MNLRTILFSQYPALFLLAVLFLIAHLRVRKTSAVKSVLWVILFGAALAASVVCCFPNGDVLEAEGDCHGTIAYAPQGENGFGYDPVFFVPELRKTFAQLTPEEKNAISHRGVALRAFGEKLKEYMENH